MFTASVPLTGAGTTGEEENVFTPAIVSVHVVCTSHELVFAALSPVFVPEFVPVISDVIATVPSLSGNVHVRAAVVAFVKKFVNVLAAFLKLILNRVSPAYHPVASFHDVSCFRFNAVCCAVDTGFAVSAVLSTLQSHTSDFTSTRSVFSVATGTSSATHVDAEVRPLYVLVTISDIFAFVTAEGSIVNTVPVHDTVMSHLSQSDNHVQGVQGSHWIP